MSACFSNRGLPLLLLVATLVGKAARGGGVEGTVPSLGRLCSARRKSKP